MTEGPPDGTTTSLPADDSNTERQGSLSAADRAAAFATGKAPIDRSAALRAGSAPVPAKFIRWIIVGFAILGVGGLLAEHFVSNAGVGSPATTPTTLAGTGSAAPPPPIPPGAPPISASLNAFIGLSRLAGNRAPALALHDQNGAPWTLAHSRGKVVVLTFFNSECNDICPVLANEITQAIALLGARSGAVVFAVVNSDPRYTSLTGAPPALVQTGLVDGSNVVFLDGRLPDLNSIWSSYGVTVTVQRSTQVVTHNDIMYFVDPAGKMKLRATPFANEDRFGSYTLAPDAIHRFAQGIADAAASLVGKSP
jgi:cytochrome oxidase Cu insertion factor (SCO1/SenC/PrrC family)